MPPQDASAPESGERASSLGGPILGIGAFAAGAALTLLAKRLIDARRKPDRALGQLDVGNGDSNEDLATVLRRAALDVAVLASGQAAERLQSRDDETETEAAGSAR